VAADYMLYDVDGGPSAVRDGWAVGYDQRFIVVEGVDFKNLSVVRGDFGEEELEAILSEKKQLVSLIDPMLDIVEDRQTLIFSPTVAMAKKVAQTITGDRPNQARSLDGSSPPWQRNSTYGAFERGEFQFLSVCGLCREGYNNPSIGAVAVFRPTKSRPLAEQMKGRGCRPLRGLVDGLGTAEERLAAIAASSKPNCIIVDLVGITGFGDCATTAHVLAAGKPDEVIDRANQNALDKDGPIDMGEEIRRAQSEIDEEREKARQVRLAKEKREQEEAERRAKIEAEVRYTEHRVKQGKGSRTVQPKRRARMLWGKHKGKLVGDVPTEYLEWVEPKLHQWWLKAAVQGELAAREKAEQEPRGAGDVDDINRLLDEAFHQGRA
jgi:superfamily II DNA or RNA helicase